MPTYTMYAYNNRPEDLHKYNADQIRRSVILGMKCERWSRDDNGTTIIGSSSYEALRAQGFAPAEDQRDVSDAYAEVYDGEGLLIATVYADPIEEDADVVA